MSRTSGRPSPVRRAGCPALMPKCAQLVIMYKASLCRVDVVTISAGCEVELEVRQEHGNTPGFGVQVLVDTRVTAASAAALQKLGIVAKVNAV